MPTPTNRTPVRVARGTYSNLNTNKADIQEGEICYATDQDKLYVKEGSNLVDASSQDISGKADLAGPTFTGVPAAPTASSGTNTTQIATTAFVTAAIPAAVDISGKANIASPTFTGTVTIPAGASIADIGTTIQAYDADTAKRDTTNTYTALQTMNAGIAIDGSYTQAFDVITPATSPAIDCSLGNYYTLDLSSTNVSGTWTFTNVPTTSYTLSIEITTGASTTIVWNSVSVNGGSAANTIKWNGGTAPTFAASKPHVLILSTDDTGASWYGSALVDYAVV